MDKINSFEDLEVWQISKNLVLEVYKLTSSFPKEENYVLIPQIRRSALSISANIAEGFGRYQFLDKSKFYLNARGSLYELKNHLIISKELGFVNDENFQKYYKIIDDLSVKINNLINNTRKLKGNYK